MQGSRCLTHRRTGGANTKNNRHHSPLQQLPAKHIGLRDGTLKIKIPSSRCVNVNSVMHLVSHFQLCASSFGFKVPACEVASGARGIYSEQDHG
jgi:hypothetical protein